MFAVFFAAKRIVAKRKKVSEQQFEKQKSFVIPGKTIELFNLKKSTQKLPSKNVALKQSTKTKTIDSEECSSGEELRRKGSRKAATLCSH